MSDAESLNDMSITSMVPVTKVKTGWENLVWIVLCALRAWNKPLSVRIQAVMLVLLGNLVKTTYANVQLAQSLILQSFEEEACIPQR